MGDTFLDVRCIVVAHVVTLGCGHVTKRVALCGHIVVNHMCQTKSPSPVRHYVGIMSKYYRVCICSMVFELAASWDRHFVVTSETCLWTTQLMMNVDNPEHDFLFLFFQIKSHPSPSL